MTGGRNIYFQFLLHRVGSLNRLPNKSFSWQAGINIGVCTRVLFHSIGGGLGWVWLLQTGPPDLSYLLERSVQGKVKVVYVERQLLLLKITLQIRFASERLSISVQRGVLYQDLPLNMIYAAQNNLVKRRLTGDLRYENIYLLDPTVRKFRRFHKDRFVMTWHSDTVQKS